MLSKEYIRRRLLGAADACGALLCGVVAVLAMRSFDDPAEICASWNDFVRAAALALFWLVAAAGIFARPARAAKVLFIAGQIVAAFLPAACLDADAWLLYLELPLLALLIFGARWRGARFAVLPVTILIAFTLTAPPAGVDTPDFPESLYLPASLMAELPNVRILAAGDELEADFWRDLPYVSRVEQVLPPGAGATEAPRRPVGVVGGVRRVALWVQRFLPRLLFYGAWPGCGGADGEYDIAVAGFFDGTEGEGGRRGFFRYLVRRLTAGGVLVLPLDHTRLLPQDDWHFAVLPGGGGKWIAARRGSPPATDPELLDRRLLELCGTPDPEDGLLLPGAFAAMYSPVPPACSEVLPPSVPAAPLRGQWLWLGGVLALWFLLRLPLCRKAAMGTAVASAETAVAMALYTYLAAPVWCENMIGTVVPVSALCSGAGLLLLSLPCSVWRRRWRLLAGMFFGISALFLSVTYRFWLLPLGWVLWFTGGAAVFAGLRREDHRAAFCGAAAGAAAGWVLILAARHFGVGMPPVAVLACSLLIPSWLRR